MKRPIHRSLRIVALLAALSTSAIAGPITDVRLLTRHEQKIDFVGAVSASHPIAFFRLNAPTGTSVDGTVTFETVGGVEISRHGAPIGVANNRCAKLDGHDGHVTTTQVGGIAKQATLMAWVDLDALPSQAQHGFYVLGESAKDGALDLRFGDDDTVRFHTGSGKPLTYTPTPGRLVHRWHLVVATLDAVSKTRVIYWDGDWVADDKGGELPNNAATLSIGANPDVDSGAFQGCIEEAALWNRALTGDEADAIYRASGIQ